MKTSPLFGFALTAAILGGSMASAAPITIYGTGVTDGSIDPHYVITASTDPGIPANAPAYVDVSRAGDWAPPIYGTDWINPSRTGSGGENFGVYSYTYTTTFDLTGFDPVTASVTGIFEADDTVTLFLNGYQVSPSNIGTYTRFTPFSVGSNYSSLFTGGVNALSFVVENGGNYATGLDAAVTGTAESFVPEPGTFAMITLAGLVFTGLGCRYGRDRDLCVWRAGRS